MEYKSFHSGSSIAIVESKKQAKVFLDAANRLPKLLAIIVWDPNDTNAGEDYTVPAEDGGESSGRVIKLCHYSELAVSTVQTFQSVPKVTSILNLLFTVDCYCFTAGYCRGCAPG